MLLPFAIDAESLEPDPEWSPSTLRACHADILEFWRRFGLILHDGPNFEQSRLRAAIQELPQKQRDLWLAMTKQELMIPCSTNWDGSVCAHTAPELCSDAYLALVDDVRAEAEFGIPPDEYEIVRRGCAGNQFVVCRLQLSRHCSVAKSADALADKYIEPGESYQSIWESRFHTIASARSSALKSVAIVDRYAIEQHFSCPQHQLSGLNRFLKLLNQDSKIPRYLTVYSCLTKDLKKKGVKNDDVSAEIRGVLGRLPSGGIKRLKLHMVANPVFSREAHGRYVRFSGTKFPGCVWDLDIGLRVFEGSSTQARCKATFGISDGTHRRVESELQNRSTAFAFRR